MKKIEPLTKEKMIKILQIIAVVICVGLINILGIHVIYHFTKKNDETVQEEEVNIDENYNAEEGIIDKDIYEGTILLETEDAGQEYIDSTLFLGDSNTARFLTFKNDEGTTFTTKNNTIGVVGMGIDSISSLAVMEFSTGRYTIPDAVKILQSERVIITFGTNNLSGNSTDTTSFIERYTKQIKAIIDAYPSVDIIVNAIPPVAEKRSYTNVSMIQIDAYNKAIVAMCEENDWKFLDSSEALKDESTGYAKTGYTDSDGLHLSQKGLQALFTYIRTHSYITDDDRPKPLTEIPTIIGVPSGLFQVNPLTNEEFTEDVTQVSCGENAWSDEYGGCYCNAGYEGDAYSGCTAIIDTTSTPSMEESSSPSPSTETITEKKEDQGDSSTSDSEEKKEETETPNTGDNTGGDSTTNPPSEESQEPIQCGENQQLVNGGCVCIDGYVDIGNGCVTKASCEEGQYDENTNTCIVSSTPENDEPVQESAPTNDEIIEIPAE